MTTAIMQPYLFPYVGYFQLIKACDTFVVYDDVNYIKQGWINRNRILINGKPRYFTFELVNSSSFKKINSIELKHGRTKNLRSIELAYKKAPEFDRVYPLLKEIVLFPNNNLAEFVTNSILKLSEFMELQPKFLMSSLLKKNNELHGEDKVIEICRILDSKNYINPIGGVELYSKENFKNHGINLYFLKTEVSSYEQFGSEFHPGLSIIDLLMFNSQEKVKQLLSRYELV